MASLRHRALSKVYVLAVGLDECNELFRWHGLTKMIPLPLVATLYAQMRQLLGGFDPLTHDCEIQTVTQADDRSHDCGVVRVRGDVADEAPIDFDAIDGQVFDILQ